MNSPRLAILLVILVAGCSNSNSPPEEVYVPAPKDSLTYSRDIAPILYENCSICHRPGEAAPFSLLSYRDARRRARQIAEVTNSRYMPPWLPESEPHEFQGQRTLTVQQIGVLAQWASEGAKEGDSADLPVLPEWTPGWQLGEPDLVIEMAKAYTVPAEGGDVFRNFVIPIPVAERHFVRTVELRPDNPRVVHHAVMAIDESRSSRRMEERDPDPQPGFGGMSVSEAHSPDGFFLGWTPGKLPDDGDEGLAWLLEPGTDFVLNMHMPTTGKEEMIKAKIGFHFTNEPPTRFATLLRLGTSSIDISAGESSYEVLDSYVLPIDVEVASVYPHAHYLARTMEAHAELPDGTRKRLLKINDWDFNWQDEYRYSRPLLLPRGTKLTMKYVYDNSSDNVRNPNHPPLRIRYGPQSSDEMGDLWIRVLPRTEQDLMTLESDFQRKDLLSRLAGFKQEITGDLPAASKGVSHGRLGRVLYSLGRIDEAILHFEESLKVDPSSVFVLNNLGGALHDQRKFAEAAACFEKALAQDPSNAAIIHFNLGRSRRSAGRKDEAVKEFRAAIALRPDLDEAHNNLGNILKSNGEVREAVKHFETALSLNPKSPIIHLNLGVSLELLGELDEAIRHYRAALAANSGFEPAQKKLAKALRRKRSGS